MQTALEWKTEINKSKKTYFAFSRRVFCFVAVVWGWGKLVAVHTAPEEFENRGFTLKTHQMLSVHHTGRRQLVEFEILGSTRQLKIIPTHFLCHISTAHVDSTFPGVSNRTFVFSSSEATLLLVSIKNRDPTSGKVQHRKSAIQASVTLRMLGVKSVKYTKRLPCTCSENWTFPEFAIIFLVLTKSSAASGRSVIDSNRTPIVRLDWAIEHNRTHTKIYSFEQNGMFDYQTGDSRTQSNVRLPNSCLFDFYV